MPSGLYLPDFWLRNLECWAEVKPDSPVAELEERLAVELADATGQPFVFLLGLPGDNPPHVYCSDCTDGSAGTMVDADVAGSRTGSFKETRDAYTLRAGHSSRSIGNPGQAWLIHSTNGAIPIIPCFTVHSVPPAQPGLSTASQADTIHLPTFPAALLCLS